MKSIILAAGYATRLYPLTENCPKPLLEIQGRPIIDYIIDKLENLPGLEQVFVVTNDKFFGHLSTWRDTLDTKMNVEIVNDETRSNEDRLGSLGDIELVIERRSIEDDVIVVAGDNLFEFQLSDMLDFYQEKRSTIVALHDIRDIELAKQYGIVAIDDSCRIIDFQEKPARPKSTLSSTCIYIYPERVIGMLPDYLARHDADKAGCFLQWLYPQKDVHGYITDDRWYDIGSLPQLEKARREFNP
jgi:glucose-1-phosphate thymidylyltransferase